jgi:arginyl-tRNA synthetase
MEMQKIDQILRILVLDAIREKWGDPPGEEQVQIQKTRREFSGDFTVVVFPLLRHSKLSPEETGKVLGQYMLENSPLVSDFNVIKGFLNLVVAQSYWKDFLDADLRSPSFGSVEVAQHSPMVMIPINPFIWGISGTIFWDTPSHKFFKPRATGFRK